jgi:hypothetical protein
MEDFPKIDEFGLQVAGMQESFTALAEMVSLLLYSVARGGELLSTSTDLNTKQALELILDGREDQLKQKLATVKAWAGTRVGK